MTRDERDRLDALRKDDDGDGTPDAFERDEHRSPSGWFWLILTALSLGVCVYTIVLWLAGLWPT